MVRMQIDGRDAIAPRPALGTLSAWLDVGLAMRVEPFVDALAADADPDAVLVAIRALRQLGDDRRSDSLALRLGRRHPGHVEARLAMLRAVGGNRGAFAHWRAAQRWPAPAPDDPRLQAAQRSHEAVTLAQLRDDALALASHREALALCADDPWLWVEQSYSLQRLDRLEDALASARQAMALCPGHRTGLLQASRLLQSLRRHDEAEGLLEQALQATGGAAYAWQLFALADDAQQPARALALLDRTEAALPRADRGWRHLLAARRSDVLLRLGRLDEAREQALKVPGTGFFARLAERLAQPGPWPAPTRRLIPLAMVQQHWMTCAPATLTALAGHWGRPADHVEVAQAICYDGTPQASERQWACSQGFWVREFRLDWPTACALLEAGVPFALATQHVGGGHLQAVVGFDRVRRTLLVRDPSQPLHAEYEAEALFEAQESNGPRAMLMLPPAERGRVAAIALPEAEAWDLGHEVLAALQRHDRPAAMVALAELRALEPEGDSTLHATRHIALYDGDEARILAATEALLARYPDDTNLQLSRLASLYEVQGQAAGDAWLQSLVERPYPDALLLTRWAAQLWRDVRRLPQAQAVVRRALRRDGLCGRAWAEFANQRWAAAGAEAAVAPARIASTLMPTEEWAANEYLRACRVAGRLDEGLAWLRQREQAWGDRSARPTITLADELANLQRDAEADAVLAAALVRRPDDATLRLHLAERELFAGRDDEAATHLDAATAAPAPARLRLQALLLEQRGDLAAAEAAVREALAQEPLQLSHHRLLLRLLSRRLGDAEALAQWRPLADAYPAHIGLQQQLYHALPDQPGPINEQLDRLHAHHPEFPWLQRERAVQASRQDRHDDAVALAEAALRLAPASATAHDVLAFCRLRRDGYAAALPHMHEALRLDAENEGAAQRLLTAPDAAGQTAGVDFIAAELRRQVLLGDGLLHFQAQAAAGWPPEQVLAFLQDLAARWPAHWQGPVALARQWVQMSRPDEALVLLQDAAQRFPMLPRVHHEQGEALRVAGRIDEALEANARALVLSPGWNRAVRLQVTLLTRHRQRAADAEAVLRRALLSRDAWNDADLIGLLGWVQELQGRDADALANARRSLLLDPTGDWVWGLAERVHERAQTPLARDALIDEVVASRPGDATAWLVRAENARDDEAALAAAERALALSPRLVAAWQARFERLARLSRLDAIEAALQQLPWPPPAPLSLRVWQPRVQWMRGERREAVAALRRLREEAPFDEDVCVRLADWLDTLDDHPGYLAEARALLQIAPQAARSHVYLGHALLKSGQAAEAVAPLQRALALSPAFVYAARQLVEAARQSGQHDAAEPALQALWPNEPDVPTACDGIELAAAAGARERAFAWLERLFELEQFDIDRSRRALGALRDAGWGGEVAQRQRAQLERGGGPVGVALDWLERQGGGLLWLAGFRAHRLLRRQPGVPLLVALLRFLIARESRLGLGLLLRRHEAALRAHPMAWGEASFALSSLEQHGALVRWMHDWRTQARPPDFALANLANSLGVLRRWDALAELVRAMLQRHPLQEDLRLWQLFLLARDGDAPGLQAALARCHEWTPDAWMDTPLQALRAYAELVPGDRRDAPARARLRALSLSELPASARTLVRELRRLARG